MFTRTVTPNKKKKQFFSTELPLRVRKPNPNEHTLRVATICSGDFFGEEEFFEEHPRELTATVISPKAKMYKLSFEKFKSNCKGYSDILKEIRKMMGPKTHWKKERLEGLYQRHTLAIQENQNNKEFQQEQEKSLASLNVLSPEAQQSSNRLKLKLMERAKINHPALAEDSAIRSDTEKGFFATPKKEKIVEPTKDNTKLPETQATTSSKRVSLKPRDNAIITRFSTSDSEEISMFSRASLPRQYNHRFEEVLKKDKEVRDESKEVIRLDLRDSSALKRLNAKKSEPKKPESQSKDSGTLSAASIRLLKKRFLKKKMGVTSSVVDIRQIKEFRPRDRRTPSLDLDVKHGSQQELSIMFNPTVNSLNERVVKTYAFAPAIHSPDNLLPTSLDKLDKPEKGSMTTVEGSTKNTLSKGSLNTISLGRIPDELAYSRPTTALSPIHPKLKSRTSYKLLKSTLGRRDSCSGMSESMQNSNLNIKSQNSFRIMGEKSMVRNMASRSGTKSIKNIRQNVSVTNVSNKSQL